MNNSDNRTILLDLIDRRAIFIEFKPIIDVIAPHLHNAKFEIYEEGVDAFNLADIYEGRYQHLKNTDIEFGGLMESARALKAEGGRVRLATITTTKYHVLCFVTMALDRLVGIVYITHTEEKEY